VSEAEPLGLSTARRGMMTITKEDALLCVGFTLQEEVDEQQGDASVAFAIARGKGTTGRAAAKAPPAPRPPASHLEQQVLDRARPRDRRGTSRTAFV
jgi:hypothetical protein